MPTIFSRQVGSINEVFTEMKELRSLQGVKEAVPVVWIDSGTYLDPKKPNAVELLTQQAIKDGGFFAARSGRT